MTHTAGFDLGYGLTLAVMLLVSPLGWMYYFPLLLLPGYAVWLLTREGRLRPLRWGLLVAWGSEHHPHVNGAGRGRERSAQLVHQQQRVRLRVGRVRDCPVRRGGANTRAKARVLHPRRRPDTWRRVYWLSLSTALLIFWNAEFSSLASAA